MRHEPDNAETLEARGVKVHFDGVRAVDGVDLTLARNEILGLIGPNGAGKTTLVNAVTRFVPLTEGTMSLAGNDVAGWHPHKLARHGVGRVFQNARAFGGLTVAENVQVGAVAGGMSRQSARIRARELLELVGLADLSEQPAASLGYGQERLMEIARAAAVHPIFLLLDEPAAGLNDAEGIQLVRVIRGLSSELGCGVLVIEHDMRVIMRLCERIQVLNYGKSISVGTPEEVRHDPEVIAAYLGTASTVVPDASG